MRFSLKTLLAAFSLVAIGCVGVFYASRVMAAWFFTAALFVLLLALVAALVRKNAARAYWFGFTVFGAPYFLISIYGDVRPILNRDGQIIAWEEPRLLTSQFLLWADNWARQRQPERVSSINPGRMYVTLQTILLSRGWSGHTHIIGDSFFTMLFGLIGGTIGRLLYRNGKAERKTVDIDSARFLRQVD
ncbi:MAG TPA: hypothetical protein VJ828_05995 [Lacipirellulaceae bacterium]|nr:hypothetical protein [Lacipirellulaceae bacterium]